MQILHIASFNGNIGDHANHSGFRRCMGKYINGEINYIDLEIREFYKSWGMRTFDDNFVNYANQFDLIVIGGGNYFEMCWDYSVTGTTINISEELLNKIKPPILFNGMGIDDKNGKACKENINKFERFLLKLTSSSKYLVTVRNDGSKKIAEKYFDSSITDKIFKIPDGGFFISPKRFKHIEIPNKYKVIAINLAGDEPNVRFSENGDDRRLKQETFIKECSEYINEMLQYDDKLYFTFVSHIIKDYDLISKVLLGVKDYYLRSRISIAPYLNGEITNADYIFDLYKECVLAIGMRYHSNVCSIAVNTPTIGIVNLPKHKLLYEDIGMQDRVIASDEPGFGQRLLNKTKECLNNVGSMKKDNELLLDRLGAENEKYFSLIKEFLNQNNVDIK